MAGDWRSSTWGEEISLEYGKALRGYEDATGEYRVFGSNGPIGWATEPLALGPGVILGRKGAYRGVQYSPAPFYVIDTAYYVVPKTELDMRWLYYAIQHYKLGEVDDGSPIPSTTRAAVYVRDLEVPPPEEQRTIAHILGTLDDKIELNRSINETLEAMGRALFKSWFVDFDPVCAKAEGRDPGLPQHWADLFPDSFEDSELGDIPQGWHIGNVSDLCNDIYSGGTPSTQNPHYWNGDIPWLSSGETREKFITDTEKRITRAGVSNSSTRLAPALSTVIASAGQGNTRGQTSLFTIEGYVNQSVVVLIADPSASSPCHLFFDLERRYEEFRRVSDAHSSRGSLTTKLLAGLPAVLPPIQIIRRFDSIVMSAVQLVVRNLSESRTLATLRNTLLPKLISGELKVNDAERFVKEHIQPTE